MADNDNIIKIKFLSEGDKGLVKAIQKLDIVHKKLTQAQENLIDVGKKGGRANVNAINTLRKYNELLKKNNLTLKDLKISAKTYSRAVRGNKLDLEKVRIATMKHTKTLKQQKNASQIFKGVINQKDLYHLTLCNPPFHASEEEASKGSERKWKNLGKTPSSALNFGGHNNELWCEGGEVQFISNMIKESEDFAEQVLWFTSLVSKKDNIAALEEILKAHPIQLQWVL